MAVTVQERSGRLTYRLYLDGRESREPTGVRATAKNRERLERKAQTMSDLMAEGRFDYLQWFPDGNLARHYRPAPPAEPTPVPTVRAYADGTWLPRKVPPFVRKTLADTYRSDLRCHVLPAFGDTPLDALTRGALLDFRAMLTRAKRDGGKSLKMKTARCIMDGTFRALHRDARRDGLVTGDPFADLDWPRTVAPEPDPFTEAERDVLLDYFWRTNRHYYPLVYTMFFTGMRTGEAMGLRWGAVDLRRADKAEVRIRVSRTLGEDNAPKTKKSTRTILLRPEVVAVLRDAHPLHVTAETFVFATQVGTPLDEERFVEKHWHRALRKTGVRPRKFYATRHTFISLAVAQPGINLKWLADYCGTSVAMIEEHYAGRLNHAAQIAQLALLSGHNPATERRAEGVA
jgi:integrase